MQERDKQVDDQQKKHAREKELQEQSQKSHKDEPEKPPAGMSTDPEAVRDPNYARRIEEKTKKH